MKTQKQQLLDYLAIHASEAELLELCRKIKDNRVAVEFFLKDVAAKEDIAPSKNTLEDGVLTYFASAQLGTINGLALSLDINNDVATEVVLRMEVDGLLDYAGSNYYCKS